MEGQCGQRTARNLAFYPIDLQLDADYAQRYASDLGMLLGLRSESCDFQEIRRLFRGMSRRSTQRALWLLYYWFQGSTFGLWLISLAGLVSLCWFDQSKHGKQSWCRKSTRVNPMIHGLEKLKVHWGRWKMFGLIFTCVAQQQMQRTQKHWPRWMAVQRHYQERIALFFALSWNEWTEWLEWLEWLEFVEWSEASAAGFCPQIPRRVFQHYPLVSGLDKGHWTNWTDKLVKIKAVPCCGSALRSHIKSTVLTYEHVCSMFAYTVACRKRSPLKYFAALSTTANAFELGWRRCLANLGKPLLSQTFYGCSIVFDGFLGFSVARSGEISEDLPGAVGTMGPGLKLDQWKKPKFYNCRWAFLLFCPRSHTFFHIIFKHV